MVSCSNYVGLTLKYIEWRAGILGKFIVNFGNGKSGEKRLWVPRSKTCAISTAKAAKSSSYGDRRRYEKNYNVVFLKERGHSSTNMTSSVTKENSGCYYYKLYVNICFDAQKREK